jgi:hypothetical protein
MKSKKNKLRSRLMAAEAREKDKMPLAKLYQEFKDYILIPDCDPQAPYTRRSEQEDFLHNFMNQLN